MKGKIKKSFLITGVLFLLFAMFTVVVLWVDVQPIGPEGSSVGLATVNRFVFEHAGVNLLWYNVTDWLGVAALLVALGFAVLGLTQFIRRKSLWKVDYQILLLGAFYVLVAAVYVFFEIVAVNYRPVVLNEGLEASYPSSHAMIVICIMVTAMMEFRRLFAGKRRIIRISCGISVFVMAVTVVGRLVSGVHWFTDIVAGVLLSTALVMLYRSVVGWMKGRKA